MLFIILISIIFNKISIKLILTLKIILTTLELKLQKYFNIK